VAIIPFKTIDDAINIYNDTDYGLALAVITEDYRKARILREECEYGVGYVNLPTIGAEVQLPFGGVKRSGTGMPSAATLIDAVTHRVSWTVNHAEEIKMAQGLSTKL
jgi:aldehyde dehydrogenase (NAD+)